MNRRLWSLAIVAGWFVTLGAACSSSTDTSGSNGTSGKGGASGSSGGSGGNGSGVSGSSNGTGGSTNVGSSGTGGAAGSAANNAPDPTNSAACPATAPNDNDPCTMDALACGYGVTDCMCGGAMMLEWSCRTAGGNQNQMMCPATEPTNGGTCTPGRGDCMFGTRVCDCDNDTNAWACWDPADCPSTQPAEQAACDVVGMSCDYDQTTGAPSQGGRNNNGCDCTATGWDCGGQFCPATEPAGGGACEGGDGVCAYGGARVCDCDSQIWVCWAESDCPATPPVIDSECAPDGMICPFTGGDCECQGTTWDCDDGVGAATDTDGGM
jgi:hypothetical protein